MLDIGFSELLVFGIIVLLVLGPDKLPEAARFSAKWYSQFKRIINHVQNDIDRELGLNEFRQQLQQEMQKIQELEQKMQRQLSKLQQQKVQIASVGQAPVGTNVVDQYTYVDVKIPTTFIATKWLNQYHCRIAALDPISIQTNAIETFKVAV